MACFYCAPFIPGSRERAAFAHCIYWLAIAVKYPTGRTHARDYLRTKHNTHHINLNIA